jgi:hypothetical protein
MWSLRRSERGIDGRSDLYLDPAELARKLVKELESDKVTRGSRVSVRNRYTVYLCREDYRRLVTLGERLTDRLELDLTRHIRSRGYEVPGAVTVKLEADPDLEPGYFGIYGERELPLNIVKTAKPAPAARPVAAGPARPAAAKPVAARPMASGPAPARTASPDATAAPAASAAAPIVGGRGGAPPPPRRAPRGGV